MPIFAEKRKRFILRNIFTLQENAGEYYAQIAWLELTEAMIRTQVHYLMPGTSEFKKGETNE